MDNKDASKSAASTEEPASDSKFALVSSRVVTGGRTIRAAVLIQDGWIIDVVDPANLPADVHVEDVGDLVISPGLIDAHVHVNEPGRTEWEGFETATAAAAAGGVTTIIDMPLNSSPVTTSVENLHAKRAAAKGKCHVDVGFYAGLVPENSDQIEGLIDEGVFGVKAFLCDSGLDEFPAAGDRELRDALKKLASTGVPLLAHAEMIPPDFESSVDDPVCYIQYSDSRPPEFEVLAIGLLIKLCREFDSPIHIVHLATAEALEMIKSAKQAGLKLSVETCPHYFYFCESDVADGQTSFKCAPPIRDEENRDRLRAALATGLIETIGSDHSPCPPELKSLPTGESPGDFSKAWGGIAGLQLTLSVTWTVGDQSGWSFEMMAERLSSRPAELFGLDRAQARKGKIESGYLADLVVWDPESSFVVAGQELFHRHPVTPYEGRELKGKVARTYVGGKIVYQAGRLTAGCNGKLLKRGAVLGKRIADFLNSQSPQQLGPVLETCCASDSWINGMVEGGEFSDDQALMTRVQNVWAGLEEADYLEAFLAHPRIGDVDSLRQKYANTKAIAGNEQSGVDAADEATLMRLAAANDEYFDKFGFIFIVCATGKSANQMLEILESRLPNERSVEVANAAAEQLKITKIRLEKLVQ